MAHRFFSLGGMVGTAPSQCAETSGDEVSNTYGTKLTTRRTGREEEWRAGRRACLMFSFSDTSLRCVFSGLKQPGLQKYREDHKIVTKGGRTTDVPARH